MGIFSRFFKSKKKSRPTKAAVKLQQPNISTITVENTHQKLYLNLLIMILTHFMMF